MLIGFTNGQDNAFCHFYFSLAAVYVFYVRKIYQITSVRMDKIVPLKVFLIFGKIPSGFYLLNTVSISYLIYMQMMLRIYSDIFREFSSSITTVSSCLRWKINLVTILGTLSLRGMPAFFLIKLKG